MTEKKQHCFICVDKRRLDYFKRVLYDYIINACKKNNDKEELFDNLDTLTDILHQLNNLFICDFKYLKLNYDQHILIISILGKDIKKADDNYKDDLSFCEKINLIYEVIHSFDY